MFISHLFGGNKFEAIVGEEEEEVNILQRPYSAGGFSVPQDLEDDVEKVRNTFNAMAAAIPADCFESTSVFIDPIDGTREFSSGKGEQCTIMVGFAVGGRPVAGLVYRPLTQTYAMGCKVESCYTTNLEIANSGGCGFLGSNGPLSPFTMQLAEELGYSLVRSGGAGNKMLMLLEGRGDCYIQDRSVNRWDTCAPQAILEATGGTLAKLYQFTRPATTRSGQEKAALESYTYNKSEVNLDYVAGVSSVSRYNFKQKDKVALAKHAGKKFGNTDADTPMNEMLPYFNMCGLLALRNASAPEVAKYHAAALRAKAKFPDKY